MTSPAYPKSTDDMFNDRNKSPSPSDDMKERSKTMPHKKTAAQTPRKTAEQVWMIILLKQNYILELRGAFSQLETKWMYIYQDALSAFGFLDNQANYRGTPESPTILPRRPER